MKKISDVDKALNDVVDAANNLNQSLNAVSITMEQLFREAEQLEKKRFFLFRFIDSILPTIFGYRTSYILFAPHVLVPEVIRNLKWALQRVYRMWDDRAVWSVDMFLCEILPPIIEQLADVRFGVPSSFMPNSMLDSYNEYSYKYYRSLYRIRLLKIAKGFRAYIEIGDTINFEKRLKLRKEFEEGMKLFVEEFPNLWD